MSGNSKFKWFLLAPIVISIFFIANFSEGQSVDYYDSLIPQKIRESKLFKENGE
jgi:hypothetical protein